MKIIIVVLIPFFLVGMSSCEKSKGRSDSQPNSPPVITSVNILPENPKKGDELHVVIQGQDPEGDPVTYHYQWNRNDNELSGENNNVLKSGSFSKGDLIRVKVTPSDGKADGKPVLSAPVKILNTPPVIQEVWIEPKIAYAHDSLKAIVKSDDRDGDMVYVTYRWEKNGLNLNDERGERIRPGQFKKGDVIIVEITPDDRETSGTPKKSPPLIISNTPPQIVSNPQISVEGSIYTYQVKAIDPDQDPVAFTLKSGPKGMEINKKTGLIRWDIRKEDRGVHSIEIEGSDPEGAKCIQQYKLTIEFK